MELTGVTHGDVHMHILCLVSCVVYAVCACILYLVSCILYLVSCCAAASVVCMMCAILCVYCTNTACVLYIVGVLLVDRECVRVSLGDRVTRSAPGVRLSSSASSSSSGKSSTQCIEQKPHIQDTRHKTQQVAVSSRKVVREE